jgi:hypothetical protein
MERRHGETGGNVTRSIMRRQSAPVRGRLLPGTGYRLLLLSALFLVAFQRPDAQAQTIENWTDLVACPLQLAWRSRETDPAREALQSAQRSGDVLAVAEAIMFQVYPMAAKYCSASAADQLRESAAMQLLGAGASAQMSKEIKQFLQDLQQRGLGGSPRTARLQMLLAIDAEAAGRISDALRFTRRASAILQRASTEESAQRQAEEMLQCLQKDVAAGTTSCGADEATDGPFAMAPPHSFCSRRNPTAAALTGVLAAIGRPTPAAFDAFCNAEARMRELITNKGISGPTTSDRVIDAMLGMAAAIDRITAGNAVARSQLRDLAAAYAEEVGRAARVAGDTALADHLLQRAHDVADASATLRRQAAQQLLDGYKGWMPVEPWGAHLIALMLETHVPQGVFEQEAFAVMAAAKFDSTSLELRAMAARHMSGARADLDDVEAAKAALHPREAMLAVRFTPAGAGIALLLRHDSVRLYPITLEQAAAAKLVTAYHLRLVSPTGPEFDPTEGVLLYNSIFGPLDADHGLDGVDELFLVPRSYDREHSSRRLDHRCAWPANFRPTDEDGAGGGPIARRGDILARSFRDYHAALARGSGGPASHTAGESAAGLCRAG